MDSNPIQTSVRNGTPIRLGAHNQLVGVGFEEFGVELDGEGLDVVAIVDVVHECSDANVAMGEFVDGVGFFGEEFGGCFLDGIVMIDIRDISKKFQFLGC